MKCWDWFNSLNINISVDAPVTLSTGSERSYKYRYAIEHRTLGMTMLDVKNNPGIDIG